MNRTYNMNPTFICYTCEEEQKKKEKSLVVFSGGSLQKWICKTCARKNTVLYGHNENLKEETEIAKGNWKAQAEDYLNNIWEWRNGRV